MWAKIITIKRTKDLNYFSLCALNLFNTQVSQFELNYWNKWTFPQHSNLLRCTCICRIRKEWSCIWWIWGGTTMGFTSYSPSDSHIHRKQLDPWEIIFNFSQHTMITAKYAKTHIRQHISIGNTKTWEQEPYGCDIMVHSATWPVCVCVCGVCGVWCVVCVFQGLDLSVQAAGHRYFCHYPALWNTLRMMINRIHEANQSPSHIHREILFFPACNTKPHMCLQNTID